MKLRMGFPLEIQKVICHRALIQTHFDQFLAQWSRCLMHQRLAIR